MLGFKHVFLVLCSSSWSTFDSNIKDWRRLSPQKAADSALIAPQEIIRTWTISVETEVCGHHLAHERPISSQPAHPLLPCLRLATVTISLALTPYSDHSKCTSMWGLGWAGSNTSKKGCIGLPPSETVPLQGSFLPASYGALIWCLRDRRRENFSPVKWNFYGL